jgi:hypothetical protein
MFERHHGTVATAPTFREDDEDCLFFLQLSAQISEGVRAAILSPHWQGVEDDCRKRTRNGALKENVARSDRERAFAMPRYQRCSKREGVEMTAMIRCEHKRTVRRQLLTADDRQSMCDREVTP